MTATRTHDPSTSHHAASTATNDSRAAGYVKSIFPPLVEWTDADIELAVQHKFGDIPGPTVRRGRGQLAKLGFITCTGTTKSRHGRLTRLWRLK